MSTAISLPQCLSLLLRVTERCVLVQEKEKHMQTPHLPREPGKALWVTGSRREPSKVQICQERKSAITIVKMPASYGYSHVKLEDCSSTVIKQNQVIFFLCKYTISFHSYSHSHFVYLVQWQTMVVSWVSSTVTGQSAFCQPAEDAAQRQPSTYRYLMSFNHVIKLLINLFVFLLSAWGEDESRLEFRTFAAFVLLPA